MPEVKLGEYRGVKVARPVAKIDDSVIAAEIERMRQRFATLSPAPEKEIEAGDIAIIDYALEVDGAAVEDAGVNGYPLEVGTDTLFPQLNEGLLGAKQGETRRIEGKLPETYSNPDLAGKDAVFVVTIKDVKSTVLPDLNDDFAKRFNDITDLEDLRNKLREALEANMTRMADATARERLITQVVDASEVALPETMIDRFRQAREREVRAELAQHGATLEDYLTHQKMSQEAWAASLDLQARRNLKRFLVLRAIQKQEGIQVSEDEIVAEVVKLAETNGVSPATQRRNLEAEEGALEDLVSHIQRDKALQLLMEAAEITDEELAPEAQAEEAAKVEAEAEENE
jgi:trigger factor